MQFSKYHALGNDYIVLNPSDWPLPLSRVQIRRICHRNFGIGSDGILLGPIQSQTGKFAVRIFNPDGSEAEKSGNGLRIFSRYLWDNRRVGSEPFTIETLGGMVRSQVLTDGKSVAVDMGQVRFHSRAIPVQGDPREVLNEPLPVDSERLTFCAATIGNPHCVIVKDEISAEETRRLGPKIETHPLFPNRTNVQFMKILDRGNIQIEIWERGAGYTLASGSSACASAAVAFRLGRCDSHIVAHMQGGKIDLSLSEDFSVSMRGAVTKICDGTLDPDMFESTLPFEGC